MRRCIVLLIIPISSIILACSPKQKISAKGEEPIEASFFKKIKEGDIKSLTSDLDSGLSPNIRKTDSYYKQTPLMEAVSVYSGYRRQQLDIVKLLLDRGADPNIMDNIGQTALMYTTGSDRDVVELLLKRGADPDIKDKNGQTILMKIFDKYVIDILLKKGANPNIKDKWGKTALIYSIPKSDNEIINSNHNIKNKLGGGPTLIHQKSNYIENMENKVELLLVKGADPNIKDNAGRTALIYAAMWGARVPPPPLGYYWVRAPARRPIYIHTGIIKLLLKHGADPNVKDSEGQSAVSWAQKNDNLTYLKTLEDAIKKTPK